MYSQHILNGLLAGSTIALVAAGFWIVYHVCKFFHFAHAALLTFAPYIVYLCKPAGLLSFGLSVLVALMIVTSLAVVSEVVVYRKLRKQGGSGTAMLVAAIGIHTVIQNAVSLGFGDDTRSFRWWSIAPGWSVYGTRVTTVQIAVLVVSWLTLLAFWILMSKTILGRKLRAVASNAPLARVVGIDPDSVALSAMIAGALAAGVAGVAVASDIDMAPMMGAHLLLTAVVAVIVGGGTSIWGTALGGLLIGMAQHIGVIWIPTRWQGSIAFLILIGFLIFRPQGIFGERVGKASV